MIDIVTEKKTAKRELILSTAFREWGKTNFVNTGLSAITDKLGLTKPSLYRHFSGKDEIIRSMEEKFLADYAVIHEKYFYESSGLGFSEAVRLFIRYQFFFYYENPYYYIFFLIHMLKTPFGERPGFHELMKGRLRHLRSVLSQNTHSADTGELTNRLHFLYVAGTFWFSRDFIDQETRLAVVPSYGVAEIEKTLNRCADFCLHGLYRETDSTPIAYARIEAEARIGVVEKPHRDRIFAAIEEVVEEYGLREASLDRIAAKLGMSKSSLYFYFRNKEDMFAKMIEQEQTVILSLLRKKMSPLHGFAEESYCYMVVTASHTLNNPSLLTLLNWLRFQNIGIPLKAPAKCIMLDYFSFITEAFKRGELKAEEDDIFQAATFLHVLSYRLISDFKTTGASCEAVIGLLRSFHRLYLFGLSVAPLSPVSGDTKKENL